MGFINRPQSLWWRKLLFQVHLWTGIGLGLYILVISVSGAALVFREEIQDVAEGPIVSTQPGEVLDLDEVKHAVETELPGWSVAWLRDREDPREAMEVWLEIEGEQRVLLVDPVSGEILGTKAGVVGAVLNFLADLHIFLLAGRTGLLANGVGAGFLLLMCLTGLVIWWPGIKHWRRALTVDPSTKWKRLNWDLHSAVGFWTLAFVLVWGVTGVYFAFPEPFRKAVAMVAPVEQMAPRPNMPEAGSEGDVLPLGTLIAVAEREIPGKVNGWIGLPHHEGERSAYVYRQDSYAPDAAIQAVEIDAYTGEVVGVRSFEDPLLGDAILQWFGKLHFGNFGGMPVKILWTVFGLSPALLFATGSIMWWNRVASKRWRAMRARQRAPETAARPLLPSVPQTRYSEWRARNL